MSWTIGRKLAATIASAVEEQGAATQDVTSNITSVNQAASETGAASAKVLSSAGQLSEQSELLKREVDTFVARVRAA